MKRIIETFPGWGRFMAVAALPLVLLALPVQPSRAATQVYLTGPHSAGPITPDPDGRFVFPNVPLRSNSMDTFTVSAVDDAGTSYSREVSITQVSLDQIVVSKVTTERLSVQEVERLVEDGVIDLDDPENFHVSVFDIVLTIAEKPVPIRVPVVLAKAELQGYERFKPLRGTGSGGGGPKPRPVEIVIFEKLVPGPPGQPWISIPGVLVIEGRIKSLKEFFSVRLLLMNTSGIFTLSDVTATIDFPDSGLTNILPADGIIAFDEILPGDGDQPGQMEREFIIRGDEIGLRGVRVSYGGQVTGPGIAEDEPIAFNGSALSDVEVKGPPTFDVQVSHPDFVVAQVPYDLTVEITNTGDIPALYASLGLDLGADGELVSCELDPAGEPVCTDIEGSDVRNLGHLLPGETVTQVFTVLPFVSGQITSCMAAADQNISLRVLVGAIGCLVGEFPPDRMPQDGSPAVSVLPTPNIDGVHTDSPVVAFFSETMDETTITTGLDGTFNVFDAAETRVPGQFRFSTLNERTVAIWQVNDGVTNRLKPNTEYTVQVTTAVADLDGDTLQHEWVSTFRTTGTGLGDLTPPTLALSIKLPVDPNYVLPGQIIKVDAYATDQGSSIARVEARIKDLDEPGAKYQLIDQKTVFEGDLPPFIFSIDSANLVFGHAYQLLGTAFDGNGNLRDSTLSFIVAPTAAPPTIALPDDPAAPVLHGISVNATPVTVTGGGRRVDYYLDGAAAPFQSMYLAPYQCNLRTVDLPLGGHIVRAVVSDPLGQTGEDSLTFTLVENLNMPIVGFTGAQNGAQIVSGSNLLVRATAQDPVGIVAMAYYLDDPSGAALYEGTAPILLDTTGLSLGNHAIYVSATNALGLSNDLADPASVLSFAVVEPPPGTPPPPPTPQSISYPEEGVVTVTGTAAPGARVDVTNVATGQVVSVQADGNGAFTAEIDAQAGDELGFVAYDFTQCPDPSTPSAATTPTPPVLDQITVAPLALSFNAANQFADLVVTGHYADGSTRNLTGSSAFSSGSPSVASVSSTGRVVALAHGTATVTATSLGNEVQIPVTNTINTLTGITVSPSSVALVAIGQSQSFEVTGHYSDGSSQTLAGGNAFSTGDMAVASVTGAGLVIAAGDGTTLVTVSRSGVTPVAVPVSMDTSLDPLPTVSILSPADGSAVERGDTVTVTVRARDDLGGVTRVVLDVTGATTFSEVKQIAPASLDTTQVFSFPVAMDAPVGGLIIIEARAEDTSGHSSALVSLALNVVDETPPSVTITAPAHQAPFNFGDTVTVSVDAGDDVGVASVRYETSGALTFSAAEAIVPDTPSAQAQFSFDVPFGVLTPDVRIRAYAVDIAGNEGAATPVDILLTDADITPPETVATAVSDPGAGSAASVSYAVTAGLGDLDHVELYFRRNGIGTFNRYTDADHGNSEGLYFPSNGDTGAIEFDSTKMGGDGAFEFYTVGVDLAGNREPSPVDGGGGADQSAAFNAGTVWSVISASTTIAAGDTSYNDRNLRIAGAGVVVTLDGSHTFRNMEILGGAVLTHPETTDSQAFALDLTAWTLSIDAASAIDVAGRGYLGGNRTGLGETAHTVGFTAGAERGNGGSYGGSGGHYSGAGATSTNPVYGSLTNPMDLGSGGGAYAGDGGDGGGRVFLSITNLIVDGAVRADGGTGAGSASGEGSGGSINVTTRTLSGAGPLAADGGGVVNTHTGGGGGRIAVRYLDRSTYNADGLTARGGDGAYGDGADGTVFLLREGQANGQLIINGVGTNSPWTDLLLPGGQVFDSITLQNGARVIAQDPIVIAGDLLLRGNSVLTHPDADESGLVVDASRVIVETGSAIDVTGRGYPGGNHSGFGESAQALGLQEGSDPGCGGAYGGRGARYSGAGGEPNLVYGDPKRPTLLGSGGGAYAGDGGSGGGFVRIRATDAVIIDGAVRADGGLSAGSASGEGSGGSVWITTSRLSGAGAISADGGGVGNTHTSGGGGRVAIELDYIDPNGDLDGLRSITAWSGRGAYDDTPSAAGTVYLRYTGQTAGDLIIDDGMVDATAPGGTQLPLIGPGSSVGVSTDTLTVDGIVPLLPNGLAGLRLNPDLTQNEVFEIVSNTETQITVTTPNENGVAFVDVAAAGATYGATWTFDNVRFRRGGHLELGDPLTVLDTLELREFGLLIHPETTTSYEGRLELEAATVRIDPDSAIDVTGRGYRGGNKTGLGETAHTVGFTAGAERGNGGSHGGSGGHFSSAGATSTNPVYGSLTDPVGLGSGGGAYAGAGGDGGGRVFLTTTDLVVDGAIRADGGISSGSASGEGSGGTVNILTETLAGSGLITANGGGVGNTHTGGGGGRVAIRYNDPASLTLPPANIRALGGDGYYGDGGHGTVFLKHTGQTFGDLVIDGQAQGQPIDSSQIPVGLTFDNIDLRNGAMVVADHGLTVTDTLRLSGNSVLTHRAGDEQGLVVDASRVVVEAGSAIDVTGRGYPGGNQSGFGEFAQTLGARIGSARGSGGAYGGRGARYSGAGGAPNRVYGDPKRPTLLGSGGGAYAGDGGSGGGLVRLRTTDAVIIDGAVRANGGLSSGSASGEGSGGSVWITTSRLSGAGTISADGGGVGNNHTGGGGGRVAIELDYIDPNGDLDGLRGITAWSGRGAYDDTPAAAGTVYLRYTGQAGGDLIIDDGRVDAGGVADETAPGGTRLPLIGPGTTQGATSDALTTDGIVPLLPNAVAGLWLNPDLTQNEVFEIVSNTETQITVTTPNENGVAFVDVAAAGATYGATWTFDNVLFRRGGHLELGDPLTVLDTLELREFGLLTHPETTTSYEGRLELEAATVWIGPDSAIDVTGRGYRGGNNTGFGETAHTVGFAAGAERGNGGSYGGSGGHFSGAGTSSVTNPLYGSLTDPVDLGSGGGAYAGAGGDGGGRVFLTTTDLVVDGVIRADGGISGGSASGEGSGGTVNIVTGTLSGTGSITADGGGVGTNHTGGGGGRVAVRYHDPVSLTLPQENIRALGGHGAYGDGEQGSVYLSP